MRRIFAGWTLLVPAALGAAPATPPAFDCTDHNAIAYRIWIGEEENRMQVRGASSTREIVLSGANVGREERGSERVLIYNAWLENGKDLVDFAHEFSVRYVKRDGAARAKVAIVIDHRERLGLECKPSGISIAVDSAADETPASTRCALQIENAARERTQSGTLTRIAVAAMAAAVQRFVNSAESTAPSAREAFWKNAANALKIVDPRSIDAVAKRLPAAKAAFWREGLKRIEYRYASPAARYATWIKDGVTEGQDIDFDTIIAGFNGFVRSSGHRDRNIQAFFLREIEPVLKRLNGTAIRKLCVYLDPRAKPLLLPAWEKAIGRRTLADFPELRRALKGVHAVLEAKEFVPQNVHRMLANILKLPVATDREAMPLFIREAAPYFKKLNARQVEDLAGWMETPDERLLLRKLVR